MYSTSEGAWGEPATGAGDSAEPGVSAAMTLATTDLPRATADQALSAAEQAQLVAGFALAAEAEAIARLAEVYPYAPAAATTEDRRHAVVAELQAAFGASVQSVAARVVRCERLAELPDLLAALRSGAVDVPRALMAIDKLSVLDRLADRRAALAVVLAAHGAYSDGLTTRQWAVLLSRAITAIDPAAPEKRRQESRQDRQVRLHRPATAGDPATLVISGPAEHAAAAHAAIDALARAWRENGRDDTLDQLRHDAAIALLTGTENTNGAQDGTEAGAATSSQSWTSSDTDHDVGEPATNAEPEAKVEPDTAPGSSGMDGSGSGLGTPPTAPGGPVPPPSGYTIVLNLNMALPTLLGMDDGPCELDRVGPIPASVARELAAQATIWQRILTDPVDGHVVTQAIRSYRPTEAMRRFVLARAGGICAARGCGHRTGLQLDHLDRHPRGPTSAINLAPFDQRHHEDKTSGGWRHSLNPDTGALAQTTPTGRSYTTTPLPPPGAIGPRAAPPACSKCGTRVCPQCALADCVPPDLKDGPGCPACATDAFLTDPPDDLTPLEELRIREFRDEQRQATDYELIARINAEQLAELNSARGHHDRLDEG